MYNGYEQLSVFWVTGRGGAHRSVPPCRGDDDGELGSDAENEDMSDNEEMPTSAPVAVSVNNGESN